MPVTLYRAAQQFIVDANPNASVRQMTTPLFANPGDPNTAAPYGGAAVGWQVFYTQAEIDAEFGGLANSVNGTLQAVQSSLAHAIQYRVSQRLWIATANDNSPRPRTDITIPTGQLQERLSDKAGLGEDIIYTDGWIVVVSHFASLQSFDQLDVEISAGKIYLKATPVANAQVALEIRVVGIGAIP